MTRIGERDMTRIERDKTRIERDTTRIERETTRVERDILKTSALSSVYVVNAIGS